MPIFQYKAFASGGGSVDGVVDADTVQEARKKLRRKDVLVRDIYELHGKGKKSGAGGKSSRLGGWLRAIRDHRAAQATPSGRDLEILAGVTRQMATLLGSGIPLSDTLTAIVEQAEQRHVETLFRRIREDINQGFSFGDTLERHPQMFPELYVNMVRAGQATGNLDVVLSRLADYLQSQRALRRKVTSALTYPLMMISIGLLVVSILMTKVVPKITAMLVDGGQTLPPPTQLLIAVSDLFVNYWWVGCLIIAAISFTIERVYRHSSGGQLFIDANLLKIPVLGDLLRKQAVSRFARTFSTLLRSGVNAIQSLEITSKVVGNRVLADATDHIRERILEGTDISTPLRKTGAFPPVVGYMVAVGEQSGELEDMLDRVASAYDEEIDVATERMTALLEPILIVLLAGVVGYIVYSIVLPILQVGQFQ